MTFGLQPLLMLMLSAFLLSSCQKSSRSDNGENTGVTVGVSGILNSLPTIQFNWPDQAVSIPTGTHINVSWYARDIDDNAKVSLYAVTGNLIACAGPANSTRTIISLNMSEDSVTNYNVDTTPLSMLSTFNFCLVIDDGFSPPVTVYSPTITQVPRVSSPLFTFPSSPTSLAYHNGLRVKWVDFDSHSHVINIKTASAATASSCNSGTLLVTGILDSDKKNYWDFIPANHTLAASPVYLCFKYDDGSGQLIYSFSPLITIQAQDLTTGVQTNFDTTTPVGAVVHAGAVGNSTYWGAGGNATSLNLSPAQSIPQNSFTLEFAIKMSPASGTFQGMDAIALSKDQSILFNGPNFMLSLSPTLGLQGAFKLAAGGETDFIFPLDGINENSYGYITDGSWHHMAISWDGANGSVILYIDGKSPQIFKQKIVAGSLITLAGNLLIGENFIGELDQVAITSRIQPAALIARHSLDLIAAAAYSAALAAVPAPSASLYANLPASYTEPSSLLATTLTTLIDLPVPQFKSGTNLKHNRLSFPGRYLAQHGDVSEDEILVLNPREANVMEELAKNYHFALLLAEGEYCKVLSEVRTCTVDSTNDKVITLANSPAMASTPLGIWSGYQDLDNPYIGNFDVLPSSLTLNNYANNPIGCNGDIGGKCLAPFSSLGLFAEDAYKKADRLEPFLGALTRNVNFIQDGRDFLDWDIAGYKLSPKANLLKNTMGISWNSFQAKNLARLYSNYAFEFKNYTYTNSRAIETAPYMMMDVAGKNTKNRPYEFMKGINDTIIAQEYPTPIFTPLQIYTWKKPQTGSYGLSRIWSSRRSESTPFFAPYVSAHQGLSSQSSVPPFHYIANLKLMGVWGAEFYNAGMNFRPDESTDARDIMWSIASIGLVQGALSHAEDVVLNGNFKVYESVQKDFTILSSKIDTPIAVRKHLTLEKYLISTARLPASIKNGVTPSAINVSLNLSGKNLVLEARPQGSLYYFDNSGGSPVFFQLDKFHDLIHPQRWSKTTVLEAELYDTLGANGATRDVTLAAAPTIAYSDRAHLTGVTTTTPISYNFVPHKAGNFQVDALVSTSIATTFTLELIDTATSITIASISKSMNTSGSFQTVSFDSPINGLNRKNYTVKISVNQVGTKWDSFSFIPQ